jgi:hypothetical protein
MLSSLWLLNPWCFSSSDTLPAREFKAAGDIMMRSKKVDIEQ